MHICLKSSNFAAGKEKEVMEQIVLNVENKSILPSPKRVLGSIDGVSIAKKPMAVGNTAYGQAKHSTKKKKTELDLAIEDVQKGNLYSFKSVDALMDYLNS